MRGRVGAEQESDRHQRLLATRRQGAEESLGAGVLGRAEERLVVGEQALQHGDADGVRETKAGDAGGDRLPDVGTDPHPVEVHELGKLEDEQRQRQYREDRQRRVDLRRIGHHQRRPQQRAEIERHVQAIGQPRQPARQEVVALPGAER